MSSIFSGQLYHNIVKDRNQYRLETYDPNRFQRTIEQSADQGRREKEHKDGLEFQQAVIADLQTKLNELTEKLNNLYRRYIDNQVAFLKGSTAYDPQSNSDAVAGLPRVDDPNYPNTTGYPAGTSGILPYDDYDKIRNYSYNPFFGSKAVDESDQNVIRTFWQEPGVTSENAYRENGAFWSSIAYLWGWDLDRINATYTTGDKIDSREDVQINVTALQPNKPQYPPLAVGDRFPLNWTGNGGTTAGYPAVNVDGLRPGGVDYSHAQDSIDTGGDSSAIYFTANISTGNGAGNIPSPPDYSGVGTPGTGNPMLLNDVSGLSVGDSIEVIKNDDPGNVHTVTITGIDRTTGGVWLDNSSGISNNTTGTVSKQIGGTSSKAGVNVTGQDSLNFGWEFDDLPMSLEVTEVDTRPDGTTVPTAYKVVYDIPPTHPHYDELKVLNGTEPQIIDAPTQIQRDVIANPGLEYSGFFYFPGTRSAGNYTLSSGNHRTGTAWATNTAEGEYPPPKLFSSGSVAGATYSTSGGGDLGTVASPITLDTRSNMFNFGPNSSISWSTDGGSTYTGATVLSVHYNYTKLDATTGQGTGSGDPIVVNGDPTSFAVGDFITLSNNPGDVYQVAAVYDGVTPAGVLGLKLNGVSGAVVPPANAVDSSVTISNWGSDNTVTTPKYSKEGLIVSPSSGVDITNIKEPDTVGSADPVVTFKLSACTDITGAVDLNGDGVPDIDLSSAKVSMKYRFTVHQNYKQFASPPPLDDNNLGPIPSYNWTSNDWSSSSVSDNQGNIPQGTFGYPLAGVPWSFTQSAPLGAGAVTLGSEASPSVTGSSSAYFDGTEKVKADLVPGSTPNEVILRVFYEGDLNAFDMEVGDVQIVRYDGTLNSWTQGKYNPGNVEPIIQDGDLTYTQADTPDEVVNKYVPGVYQFTQFNDQYNNSYTTGDRNDIVRSPWEFAELNLGDNSGMSGEMYMDLNSRRLNFDEDPLQSTIPGWGDIGASSSTAPGTYEVGVSNTNYDLNAGAVQVAHDFHTQAAPGDECITYDPESNSEAYQFAESDPLTSGPRNDTVWDEVTAAEPAQTSTLTPPDPGRTANPGGIDTNNGAGINYYAVNTAAPPNVTLSPLDFITGSSNDTTGTTDRIGAAVKSTSNAMSYNMTIPTTDVNVLRKENNLLVNFGSIEQRDWSLNLNRADMYVRTVPEYTTVPRYRVDAGGNIYDLFGKGYYDTTDTKDFDSYQRVYPTTVDPATGGTLSNGQVSNFDQNYDNNPASAYNTGGSFEQMINSHDRLSMSADDYNLFDYVPDLNKDPGSFEGATYGEVYVGSLPSNFYYYRENLDDSQGESGTPPTGDRQGTTNNNNKPQINFDGAKSDLTGTYDQDHTYIHNGEMPSFVNVAMGYTEQNAKMSNTQKKTTYAVWQDFPGLNSPYSYSLAYSNDSNVTDQLNAVGNSDLVTSMGYPSSTITYDMGREVNGAGYLILNEMGSSGVEAHAIPLPLYEQPAPPYPNYDGGSLNPTSYSFNAYGAGTVTRTGSKFMNFTNVLDGVDGKVDGTYANGVSGSVSELVANGGEFATSDPLGSPDTWPDGVLLHVDDASKFKMDYPKNTVVLGTNGTKYRIMYRNTTTLPQTLFLVQDDGANLGNTIPGETTTAGMVHADLQVQELTGTYTVSVVDDAGNLDVNGTKVKVDYVDNSTQREGKLVSLALSDTQDRVGRIPGDDPRTPTAEANAIAPEIFDSPKGYVQPDAQVDLHLVSQDKDGNKVARKLKSLKVVVDSGEQIIPSTLQQTYTTYDSSTYQQPGDAVGPGFNYQGGTAGDWPIALYEDDTQINPLVSNDLNYFVSYFQGVEKGSTASVVKVVDASDFKVGQKVTINGEQRKITSISGNDITLDEPLSEIPLYGDAVHMGEGKGYSDLQMYLNRSIAMSMGAGLKVVAEYEEYEYTGFPPTIDKTNPKTVTEEIGFNDSQPSAILDIDATNASTSVIQVNGDVTAYNVGDTININGQTRKVRATSGTTTSGTITLGNPDDPNTPPALLALGTVPKTGTISHIDYENFLEVGKGRSGGSSDNEFTQELKRVLDNPEYAELFRHNLFKDIFITASETDPFNDVIASKLFLNWDRIRKRADIQQTSFTAYYKSV